MPRSFLENQRIKEMRFEKIVETALFLFSYNGYDNVTIDMITEKAEVSHGLFYHYFSSKIDVLEELNKRCYKLFIKNFEDAIPEYGTTIDYLKELNKVFIQTMQSSPINNFYVNLFLSLILKEINDTGELKYKSKKVYSNIRKIEDVYRLEHPEITKKEFKNKAINYLLYLHGISSNIIKFPNLYINRVDENEIFNKFFN